MPAIQTHGLTRLYGYLVAVDHLDLTVETGEIYALSCCWALSIRRPARPRSLGWMQSATRLQFGHGSAICRRNRASMIT